jgi:WD repeat and SOF domain-containing protein 1
VRIFPFNGGHSREVYHTKRMQRVFAVRFSGDASYVFSGGWPAQKQKQVGPGWEDWALSVRGAGLPVQC